MIPKFRAWLKGDKEMVDVDEIALIISSKNTPAKSWKRQASAGCSLAKGLRFFWGVYGIK